jgi:hypothetical protein
VNLGPQLHVGDALATPEKFCPARNRKEPYMQKPEVDTALWTSTLTGRGSAWTEWCESEDFRVPDVWEGSILYPLENARIYEIDCLEHFQLLLDRAHIVTGGGRWRILDFEEIGEYFDGIHLTEQGQIETRFSSPDCMYGWDCESTLWLNWAFNDAKTIWFSRKANRKENET